jgi:protein gp37
MAARLESMGHPAYVDMTRRSGNRSVWTGRIHLNVDALPIPLRWRTPKKIFVNSMSDLFQDGVPDEFVRDVWKIMQRADWHTFQVLTKRPENMLRVLGNNRLPSLTNVWVGTSVESNQYVERIKSLREVAAQIRFVSFEPLIDAIGKINLSGIHWAIVGGESGPGARPMKQEWVEEIQSQCKRQHTAFFFKQWGGFNKKNGGRIYRGRTWDEFPRTSISSS